ncbi:toll/interleukin-1 receptor domain-containing protein [Brevundimonas sp.]|uniref:toll/interleukin-1 receptor domain-containing protein n=1 Tax=Brevundimonas sp. TaxID=1871086 RepID=UPI0025E3A62F|nr:toll/interleukin-1 receptor domain-containing protein [Brevundimonas sp.]
MADHSLFVSHHSSKARIASQVVDELERRGVGCWVAPRDIEPGEPFDRAIKAAVADSDAILVLFCDKADNSRHVKRELILADEGGKAIIPLRVSRVVPSELSYWFKDAQWIDWMDGRAEVFDRIARQVRGLEEGGPDPVTGPAVPWVPTWVRGVPWHVWVLGAILLLWNLFGFTVQAWAALAPESYERNMGVSASASAIYREAPWALVVALAGTGGSAAAGVLLLLRRRWMFHAVAVSLAGSVIGTIHLYAAGVLAASSLFNLVGSLIIWGVIALLMWYAHVMTRRGVLR